MEGLDTQVKAKHLVGEYGHMLQMKRHQLTYTFMWLLASFVFYIIGVGQSYFERMFLTLAVLCILPTALYMVRWFLLLPYKSLTKERFEQLHDLYPLENGLFYDLLLIIEGKSVYIPVMSNESTHMKVYLADKKNASFLTEQLPKLLKVPSVEIYTSWEPFVKDIRPQMNHDQSVQELLLKYANR